MKPTASPNLWRPLRVTIFRHLLVADVISDAGAFMQNVGAAGLMVSLGAGPIYVALTQTAASLPYFLLALPAGSAGDIVDRRKLVLFTESWMMGVALLLAILTIAGVMSPWILLVLTFALSAGDAFEAPAWRAILPELVPMKTWQRPPRSTELNSTSLEQLDRRSQARSYRLPVSPQPSSQISYRSSASSWLLPDGKGLSIEEVRRRNPFRELPSPQFDTSATLPQS